MFGLLLQLWTESDTLHSEKREVYGVGSFNVFSSLFPGSGAVRVVILCPIRISISSPQSLCHLTIKRYKQEKSDLEITDFDFVYLNNLGVCKGYKERNQFKRKYWKPFGIFVYRWNWLIHLELSTSGLLRWCLKKISQTAALTLDGMKNHNTTDSTQLHEIRKKNIQP